QILVGFAAETDDIESNARLKLERKNLDYILANDVLAENSGFASDMNTIRLIPRDESKPEKIISGLKNEIAYDIWSEIIAG
ncbi:MAG: bifunctional phosphopantothenoylcysteine decarboxylase/phosphopantothenate--cysteine ligase CoaBC, partial [Synergistaceae bacterium]|nr:bifunctional phosphopantothenoylcysteine decarboxylase/phosphopantothenate--cysteine ligase CoaBC [Synergistaceae bacterium]MBQ3448462.1 bifunctional phosphopantothenoylcysteine decarboxylase/phosphopantothenate--cysteine ligase CoaBC [Synergistaceae bacterium]